MMDSVSGAADVTAHRGWRGQGVKWRVGLPIGMQVLLYTLV